MFNGNQTGGISQHYVTEYNSDVSIKSGSLIIKHVSLFFYQQRCAGTNQQLRGYLLRYTGDIDKSL